MKLSFEQIKECTLGAEQVQKTPEGIRFSRFTPEELRAYATNPLGDKCRSTAGIRMAFTTDAQALTLGLLIEEQGSSRAYFAAEVQVNGKRIGALRNFTDEMDFPARRDTCSAGAFSHAFNLEEGEKQVEIYLPWSKEAILTELTLGNATYCKKTSRERILYMYGDSITHGYDAFYPSASYSNRLADALGMQVFNKAIGGETFFPPLAECAPAREAEIVTIAYGTNDWKKLPRETLLEKAPLFLEALLARHPNAAFFMITPIWRDDQEPFKYGPFSLVTEDLLAIAARYPRIQAIPGGDLVPHSTALFADSRLHPNDEGFAHYFKNLRKMLNV